jgi:hypothetical protein
VITVAVVLALTTLPVFTPTARVLATDDSD